MEPFKLKRLSIGISRAAGIQSQGGPVGNGSFRRSSQCDDRRVIRYGFVPDTPIKPHAKIVLQCRGPTGEGVVAVGGPVPSIQLIGPITPPSRITWLEPIPSSPPAPGRFVRDI